MKYTALIATLSLALSACGASQSPEQRKIRAENRAEQREAQKDAVSVTIGAQTFSVATITAKSYALVNPTGTPVAYTVADVEAATERATGCSGRFAAGILALLGDVNSADLNELREKISTFRGWRVDLSC